MQNSADPVQPPNAASDQGLHCLLTEISMEKLKIENIPKKLLKLGMASSNVTMSRTSLLVQNGFKSFPISHMNDFGYFPWTLKKRTSYIRCISRSPFLLFKLDQLWTNSVAGGASYVFVPFSHMGNIVM